MSPTDTAATPRHYPVVLSLGMGVDSVALLLRWIHEPDSRPADLREISDLLVLIAQTGDEWAATGAHMEEHLLPLMREHRIRTVQVARASASQTDGIVFLEDTDQPDRIHLTGAYRLADELTESGTIPQAGGPRKCSVKAKGYCLDAAIDLLVDGPFLHAIGFEYGEPGRARRDATYDTPGRRTGIYPLVEWRWDRDRCIQYIAAKTGVSNWPKSACSYCPFALTNKKGLVHTLERMQRNIPEALAALVLEHRAVCLNPQQGLIAGDRLATRVAELGGDLQQRWLEHREDLEHCVYEIRRLKRPRDNDVLKVANASRSLTIHATGSRQAMRELLADMAADHGQPLDTHDGIERLYLRRYGRDLPAGEHFLVAGPAGALEKARPNFDTWWQEFLDADERQMAMAL